jgi:hypothetical protein
MPNPAWILTTAQAESFDRRLAALPRTPARELSGRLGYRGMVVKATDAFKMRLIRVHAGNVHITEDEATTGARDKGRQLERWLLETGRAQLPEDIIEIVEREVR